VISGAARTAIARENGGLRDVPPGDLAALVMKEAIKRSRLANPERVDEVIFGNTMSEVCCMARYGWLQAELPLSVPGIQIDRQCGSGSTAVNLAAALVWSGANDVILAGGVESMTRGPYFMERPRAAYQRTPPAFIRRPVSTEKVGDPPMGIIAETMAERWDVGRGEQDEFACLSQMKAGRAMQEGRFKEQIVPVVIPQKKGDPLVFDSDEHPRPGTTREALARLAPAFRAGGSVTAGNSSGINDGAGALIVAAREKAEELGMPVLAAIRGFASAGVDPTIMGIGPVPATRKVLARLGLAVGDLDVIEMNEAFAVQCIACCRELGIDWRDEQKFNPNGGAVALGHPIAATLAILIIKAVYELHRRAGRYALITACCGGGQGVATIIEQC